MDTFELIFDIAHQQAYPNGTVIFGSSGDPTHLRSKYNDIISLERYEGMSGSVGGDYVMVVKNDFTDLSSRE